MAVTVRKRKNGWRDRWSVCVVIIDVFYFFKFARVSAC